MSSGCVLRKVNQLFTCEKNCNSVEARKALLEDFVSKVYNTEAVYVDSDGNKSKENYRTLFKLSQKQEDNTMNIIYGSGALLKGDEVIKLSLTGNYLPPINGYSMKLRGENIEKEFNLSCAGNETINFFIKKTDSETSETVRQPVIPSNGGGVMSGCKSVCGDALKNCSASSILCNEIYNGCISICEKKF